MRLLPLLAAAAAVAALTGCTAPTAGTTPRAASDDTPAIPERDFARHFDRTAADQPAALQMWGSFGPTGAVSPAVNSDLSLPAGTHTVVFHCAGSPSVSVSAAPLATDQDPAAPVEPYALRCPGSVALEIATTTSGLTTTVDSDGEPGAYLVQVDPGEAPPAP